MKKVFSVLRERTTVKRSGSNQKACRALDLNIFELSAGAELALRGRIEAKFVGV